MHLFGAVYKRRLRVRVPWHVVPPSVPILPPALRMMGRGAAPRSSPASSFSPRTCTGITTYIAQRGLSWGIGRQGQKVIKQAMIAIAKYTNRDQKESENGKRASFPYLKNLELAVSEQRGIKDT